MRLAPRRHLGDRVDDVGVSATAADVAAHPLTQLGCAEQWAHRDVGSCMARNASPHFLKNGDRRANLAGRAVAALEAIVFHKCGLHRVQALGRTKAFDSGHLCALVHHCERQAGIDPLTIHDDRASTALPMVTALLCADQIQVLSEGIKQSRPIVQFQRLPPTVDIQCDRRRGNSGSVG
jgi:hypothetical protein